MSFRLLFIFLIFVVFSVYLAFLNPQEIEIHLTQEKSLNLPAVVFLLGAMLAGVLFSTLIHWTRDIGRFFGTARFSFRNLLQRRKEKRWEKLYEQGENAFTNSNYKRAGELFEETLSIHPGHIGSLDYLGNILRITGDHEKAMDVHLKAVELAPDNVKVLYHLADDYMAGGLHEKAIQTLKKIQDIDHHSLLPIQKLRDYYFKLEEWDPALETQKTILNQARDAEDREREKQLFSQILYGRGLAQYKERNFDQAVLEFKRAIKENPNARPAYITLGELYLDTGDRKAALKIWKTGFEKTRSLVCLNKLQTTFEDDLKTNEMTKLYEKAIKESQESEREAFVLAMCAMLLKQQKPEEAIKTLEHLNSHTTMLHRVLLLKAYRDKNDSKESERMSKEIFDQALRSVLHYSCQACFAPLEVWSGTCPNCNTWDSVTYYPAVQSDSR